MGAEQNRGQLQKELDVARKRVKEIEGKMGTSFGLSLEGGQKELSEALAKWQAEVKRLEGLISG